jgi:hypothetical protein
MHATAIAPRLAVVLAIIQQAAHTEPDLAALWDQIAEPPTCAALSPTSPPSPPLRIGVGDAADIVWATNAAELYQLLVGQRGWSPQRYERFLADTWRRLLLPG